MAHVRSYAPAQPCAFCGASFRPRVDLTKRGGGKHCSRTCWNRSRCAPLPPIGEMTSLYVGERLKLTEIAARYGVGWQRVRRALADAGVKLRPGGWRPTSRYQTTYGSDGTRTTVHQAVAQEHGLVKPGEIVHHINTDKTDNRPENLAGMTRVAHAKAHHDLQRIAGEMVKAGLIEWRDGTYTCSSHLERLLRDA